MWISKFRTAAGTYKLTDADCDLESKIKKDKTVYLRGVFEMLHLWKRKLNLLKASDSFWKDWFHLDFFDDLCSKYLPVQNSYSLTYYMSDNNPWCSTHMIKERDFASM